MIFIVNALDIILFDIFTDFYGIQELKITEFASKIVFHTFVTLNIFIPFARNINFFKSKSEIEILCKTIGYLFIIFYCSFKFKYSVFDPYLKKKLEKIEIFKKILNFELKENIDNKSIT